MYVYIMIMGCKCYISLYNYFNNKVLFHLYNQMNTYLIIEILINITILVKYTFIMCNHFTLIITNDNISQYIIKLEYKNSIKSN